LLVNYKANLIVFEGVAAIKLRMGSSGRDQLGKSSFRLIQYLKLAILEQKMLSSLK